ncbi:VOC family protein [Reichenbachiella agarivorans]|uniref:VOC family protein n=1 Tax=Reichenbachiella agarivorans TaxID=2979464 RepID=A0ABY6CRW7_9BACT|nr:VOC family protein [Reichenbachiella agarivorans]UXP33266.1 VOC family protein [Reichenbachiella agarivorans]
MNLNQITVPSSSLERAVPFYQKLGLKLIVDALPKYARLECPDGTSTFSIHHVDDINTTNQGITVYFECEELDDEYDRLIELGLAFATPPTNQDWLWKEASLFDPDGNRIILYYAGENRKNPPWRVK